MRRPDAQLDQVFFALSDATRRAIVGSLAGGPRTVGQLAEPFSISAPAISKHMKVLERAGLIFRRVEGRHHHCALNPRALEEAEDWLRFYRDSPGACRSAPRRATSTRSSAASTASASSKRPR